MVNLVRQYIHLLLFIVFGILLFVHVGFQFCGFYGNDDINYARLAGEIVNTGNLTLSNTDHFPLRITCIAVAAFFYKLLGFTSFATALFSLICLTLTGFLVYQLLRKQPIRVLICALVLFFFSFITIFYAHRLLPDAGICFFVFFAYYCYNKMRFSGQPEFTSAFCVSSALFLAVLTKETIIITVPFWLSLLISDLLSKKRTRFWLYTTLMLALMGGLYLLYFKLKTNEWFFRYHVLNRNSLSGGGITYQSMGWLAVFKRLFFDLWNAFLLNGDFEYLAFAVAAFIYRHSLFKEESQRHFAYSFMGLLLCANFMSYSINEYNPLLPDPRHYMFVLPFAAVAGAFMIQAYIASPRNYTWVLVIFVLLDIWLFFSDIGLTKYMYFAITCILVSARLLPTSNFGLSVSRLVMVAWIFVMSLNYINDFIRPRYPYYFDQQFVIKQFFLQKTKESIVYTGDNLTAELSDFFLEFKNTGHQFINLNKEGNFAKSVNADIYILVNGDYNSFFGQNVDSLMRFAFDSDQRSTWLVANRNNVLLYRISDTSVLQLARKFSSKDL